MPRRRDVELPLQTLTYLDADGDGASSRTRCWSPARAEVTFIERFASPDLERALVDAVAEIVVGEGAHVRYASIQEWGAGVTHLGVQRATGGPRRRVPLPGGRLRRSPGAGRGRERVGRPGGSSEMLGVFFADGDQHFDHRSIQDHGRRTARATCCTRARSATEPRRLRGWVHVRPGAQKTDAMQTNRNIVLSASTPRPTSIPNLEIEANDVRCGHAASVGPVDEDTLFYLETRGIPRDEAERLIVTGFFQEVLDRVTLDEVRARAPSRRSGRARPGGPGDGAVRVCAAADVAVGEARRFAVDGPQVAVVNLGDEGFRAVDAICSHARVLPGRGRGRRRRRDDRVPKHGSTFDLDIGQAATLPATQPVDIFPVRTDGDDMLIEMEDETMTEHDDPAATLEVHDLHASVEGKEILNGIDLTVRQGEIHALMGPNGSGKSTLSQRDHGPAGLHGDRGTGACSTARTSPADGRSTRASAGCSWRCSTRPRCPGSPW